MKIYVRKEVKLYETTYLELGLGVPKCKKCDSKVHWSIKIISNLFCWIVGIPVVIGLLALEVLCDMSMIGTILLGFGCIWLFMEIMNQLYKWIENKLLMRHGKTLIKPVYDILSTGVWCDNVNKSCICEDYDTSKLQWDLDVVCSGGAFCVLDDREGKIVDYHDPEAMKNIYFGSKKTMYDND